MIAYLFPPAFTATRSVGRFGARSLASLVAFSAAVSLTLFALAACGSGGGSDSSSSSAPPAPSTAARQVALTDEENTQHCQGRGGIKVLTGIDDNRDGDLDVPDEVDATEYVCNGVAGPQGDVGPQGNPGVDGTATVIIYFELGQSFSLSEDAAAGDSAGTITAFTSNGAAVAFAEADSSSDAFDVSDAGEITLAADVTLDFETQNEYVIAVVATATAAPPANFSVRIAVVDVEESPLQDGTAANPYLVDTLAELQSIATGFQNEAVTLTAGESLAAGVHYRQTADIDASSSANFQPIGNCGPDNACTGNSNQADDNVPFAGSYDGGGYLISGLFIDRSSTDGVGLFGITGSDSVLENIALVGADVTGKDNTGTLVGNAVGTVRQSWASGRIPGSGQFIGGLVGRSDGQLEDSFAAVTVTGSAFTGGLVGNSKEPVYRSFALGSVSTSPGSYAGGLVGQSSNDILHSFATGEATGSASGGLIGLNGGQNTDSYATGSADGGGLVGQNSGTVVRSYRVAAGGAGTGITLAELRALACADAIFEDDDSNTCATAGAAAFPWDFGTDADLPVINGLVGGLDAQGQRLAVEFSMATDHAFTATTNVEKTIFAPVPRREAGSTLSHHWVFDGSANLSATTELGGLVVLATATTAASYSLHLTVVERDAAGTLLAVYADEFSLTVTD